MYKYSKYINTINGDLMKVKDIMTKYLITCESDASIHQISQKMKQYDIGFMIITNGQKIEGIITDRDIVIEMIANYDHKVKDYIHRIVQTVDENRTVEDAMNIMKDKKIKRLLVTNQTKVVGVISIADILNKTKENDKLIDTLKTIYSIENDINEFKQENTEFYL